MSDVDIHEVMMDVFDDTVQQYRNNPKLKAAIENTIKKTIVYGNDEIPSFEAINKKGELRVTSYRSFESAEKLLKEFKNKKVAVLNFASPINPGGQVENGALAQEECLCRISTLYPSLYNQPVLKAYYYPNRQFGTFLADNKVIYSPGVVVFKKDILVPEMLEEKDFYSVDVITCAAPNYRKHMQWGKMVSSFTSYEDEYNIHVERARHIICSALANKVDILVLGAFGCGAFQNHPEVVSKAYKDALKDYLQYFEVVEFAVYSRGAAIINYDTFKKVLLG